MAHYSLGDFQLQNPFLSSTSPLPEIDDSERAFMAQNLGIVPMPENPYRKMIEDYLLQRLQQPSYQPPEDLNDEALNKAKRNDFAAFAVRNATEAFTSRHPQYSYYPEQYAEKTLLARRQTDYDSYIRQQKELDKVGSELGGLYELNQAPINNQMKQMQELAKEQRELGYKAAEEAYKENLWQQHHGMEQQDAQSRARYETQLREAEWKRQHEMETLGKPQTGLPASGAIGSPNRVDLPLSPRSSNTSSRIGQATNPYALQQAVSSPPVNPYGNMGQQTKQIEDLSDKLENVQSIAQSIARLSEIMRGSSLRNEEMPGGGFGATFGQSLSNNTGALGRIPGISALGKYFTASASPEAKEVQSITSGLTLYIARLLQGARASDQDRQVAGMTYGLDYTMPDFSQRFNNRLPALVADVRRQLARIEQLNPQAVEYLRQSQGMWGLQEFDQAMAGVEAPQMIPSHRPYQAGIGPENNGFPNFFGK